MNYFEMNMKCLHKNKNNIYKLLTEKEHPSSEVQIDQIITETALNDEQILVLHKNGVRYRLNSSYHPTHEAEVWAKQFNFKNLSKVFTLFGLGNGIFARQIMKKLGKADFLLIYEPSIEIFLHVLNHYDITDIINDKNTAITVEGLNDFDFHNLLQHVVNITNITSQIQCAHPYYEELFTQSCINYWKEIKDNFIHTKININTEIFFGERVIINSFKNLKHLNNCNVLSSLYEDIDRTVPAIIVSAGPSVSKCIDDLKRAKGRAYIFVVDRVLDYILDNDIEPDFIVTVDPIKPVEYFTKRDNVTIPLLSEMVSNWEVLEHHKGRKIFYSCSSYFSKMYEYLDKKAPQLITGASVATTAFAICAQLNFERIILVGQDLAYDGKLTHAGGIAEKFDNLQDIMVEGVDGSQVLSRYDWYEFLIWFKDMITLHPDIEVIDAKEKGAKISGAVNMSLQEAVDKYCTKSTELTWLISKKSDFDDEDLKKTYSFIEDSIKELHTMIRKAKEAIELCKLQIKEYKKNPEDTDKTYKNFKKLSKINKYLNHKTSYLILESYITALTATHLAKLYHISDDNLADKIDTYEKSSIIYEAIIKGADLTIKRMEEALEQLE